MITYYKDVKNKNNKKNEFTVYKEIYNICISSINILRPLYCIEIYLKYKAKNVLNFCSGWGGTLVSACALNLNTYTGIDINTNLKIPYDNMISFLKNNSKTSILPDTSNCLTEVNMYYEDASLFDYTKINYDFVLSSPPYYFLEKYENNNYYSSKKEMNEKFYIPLFKNSYQGLSLGGTYVINICKEVYDNVLKPLLGDANKIIPYKKSKKQNNYVEMVYIWFKPLES
jgi:site-specific DNA-adenine methylase